MESESVAKHNVDAPHDKGTGLGFSPCWCGGCHQAKPVCALVIRAEMAASAAGILLNGLSRGPAGSPVLQITQITQKRVR